MDNDFASGVSTLFSEQKESPKLPSADIQNVMKAVMSGVTPGTLEYFKALGVEAEQNGIIPTNKLGPIGWIRDAYSTDAQNIIKKQSALTDLGFRIQNDLADAFSKQEITRQTAPSLISASAIAPFLSQTATPDQQIRPMSTMQVPTDLVPPTFDIDDLQKRLTVGGAPDLVGSPFLREQPSATGSFLGGERGILPITEKTMAPERSLDVYGQPTMDPNARMNTAQLGAYQSMLAGHTVDPRGGIVSPSLQASRETPVEVNPGNTLTNKQGVPLYTAPGKPVKDNEELRKFEGVLQAAGIAPDSAMGKQLYTEWAKKIANPAPSTQVNVDLKQESKEAGVVGEGFGKQFMHMQDAAVSASNKLNKYARLESLMDGVQTGKLAPSMTQLQAIAKDLGFEVDPTLGAKQAIASLSNELALELRNPSGGAGMPGAMSDSDRAFLVEMVPGLSKTPEGNKLILEYAKKIAKRDQDVAKLARDYRKKNKHMDEGFYDVLQAFSDKNPLFPQGPKVGSVENGYRFKGGDASQRGNWEKVN